MAPSRTVFVSRKGTTFANDNVLPKLPVPELKDTIRKYLESVRPLVDNATYKKTETIAKDFESGIGATLHQKLLEKAKKDTNWVSFYWDTYAYLTLREPLIPYYSMGGTCGREAVPWPEYSTKIQQAALYTFFMLEFWQLLKNEKVVPHRAVDGKPFTMSQFRNLFNTSRKVGVTQDAIESHFKIGDSCPSHLVVICKGRFFVLDALAGHSGLLTAPELEIQYEKIIAKCTSEGDGVSALTCDNRTQWAKNKAWLQEISSNNRKILEIIESAITIIVLEDYVPKDEGAGMMYSLGGNVGNHWLDKSMAITFFSNGTLSSLCDHAAYDGMVSISAFQYVLMGLEEMGGVWKGERRVLETLQTPEEMKFDLDSVLKQEIKRLGTEAEAIANPVCALRNEFLGYGKKFMQNQKLHPDAWVQMALQLAFYQLHKRLAPMYETATTRQYQEGRTETVRSCSLEAAAWIKEMSKPDRNVDVCKGLLMKAISKHNAMMAEARDGFGCDRHLFGLQCLAFENGIPPHDIFKDPSWTLSGGNGNFALSTSLLGYHPSGGCVAPMCLDGYGCFYNILPDKIFIAMSAWRASTESSAEKLFGNFCEALEKMQKLFAHNTISKI